MLKGKKRFWILLISVLLSSLCGCGGPRGALSVDREARSIFHFQLDEVKSIHYVYGTVNVRIEERESLKEMIDFLNDFRYIGEPERLASDRSLAYMLGGACTIIVWFQDETDVLIVLNEGLPGADGYLAFPPLEALGEFHLGENEPFYSEYGDCVFYAEPAFFEQLSRMVDKARTQTSPPTA